MGHLKQTNIDINKYESTHIRQATKGIKENDKKYQENQNASSKGNISQVPADKIVFFIVVVLLLIAIIFMINGIIKR